ncbi:UNVERIFIED_CONTAM: hypothetical protein NCL1_17126 [Trichonephila clavipes]
MKKKSKSKCKIVKKNMEIGFYPESVSACLSEEGNKLDVHWGKTEFENGLNILCRQKRNYKKTTVSFIYYCCAD